MSIAIGEDHLALLDTVRRFTAEPLPARASCGPPSTPRPKRSRRSGTTWPGSAGSGLHLPEADGGEGYGYAELAVVLEELGRAVAPGPFLPTVLGERRWSAPVAARRSCCRAGRRPHGRVASRSVRALAGESWADGSILRHRFDRSGAVRRAGRRRRRARVDRRRGAVVRRARRDRATRDRARVARPHPPPGRPRLRGPAGGRRRPR